MVSPLWVGTHDIHFQPIGYPVNFTTTPLATTWGANTTNFRSGYAQYGIGLGGAIAGSNVVNAGFLRSTPAFSASQFWFTARMALQQGQTQQVNGGNFIRFVDATGVVRLQLRVSGNFPNVLIVEKVNAAGTPTVLVTSSVVFGTTVTFGAAQVPDKIDVNLNYAVSGGITVYCNGFQICTFSGDVTTDSATLLSNVDITIPSTNNSAQSYNVTFSEMCVINRDTRLMNVVSRVATANGNTHNWDGGTAANSANNSATVGQSNPQFASTSGLIQEYQVTPALPSGSYTVASVVHTAQAAVGLSGPTKFDFMVRTGAADFVSPDQSPGGGWGTFLYPWDLNPNTGVAWTTAQLVNSSTLYNFGLKSVT